MRHVPDQIYPEQSEHPVDKDCCCCLKIGCMDQGLARAHVCVYIHIYAYVYVYTHTKHEYKHLGRCGCCLGVMHLLPGPRAPWVQGYGESGRVQESTCLEPILARPRFRAPLSYNEPCDQACRPVCVPPLLQDHTFSKWSLQSPYQ